MKSADAGVFTGCGDELAVADRSRGIYHDGWMASTFGPKTPWVAAMPDLANWDPMQDEWELLDMRTDYSLTHDVAGDHAAKLAEMKAMWMREAKANKVLPIGGGLLTLLNPSEMKRTSNTEWTLFDGMIRIPEAEAPNVRNGNLRMEIDAEVPDRANGVLFAMGGYVGGVSLYVIDGELRYDYSALLLKRTRVAIGRLPEGRVQIVLEMRTPPERAAPAELMFWIDGEEAARATVERTIPAVFTASETFDVGRDTNSPVSDDYFDATPFRFDGKILRMHVNYMSGT